MRNQLENAQIEAEAAAAEAAAAASSRGEGRGVGGARLAAGHCGRGGQWRGESGLLFPSRLKLPIRRRARAPMASCDAYSVVARGVGPLENHGQRALRLA